MKITIGNQKLIITNSESKERKGSPNQIVGWRDVVETCHTLDAVCSVIKQDAPLKIVDGIARAGMWGAIFRNRWPDCKLHLNEQDLTCVDVLQRNFPNDKITSLDIKRWRPKSCDLSLLDFDHFTLRILDQWKDVLIKWSNTTERYFIVADGACFGFKFGNMKHYGIKTDEEYYYLLNEALIKFLDKQITAVSKFNNAATILLEPKKKDKNITFLLPSKLVVTKNANSRTTLFEL